MTITPVVVIDIIFAVGCFDMDKSDVKIGSFSVSIIQKVVKRVNRRRDRSRSCRLEEDWDGCFGVWVFDWINEVNSSSSLSSLSK